MRKQRVGHVYILDHDLYYENFTDYRTLVTIAIHHVGNPRRLSAPTITAGIGSLAIPQRTRYGVSHSFGCGREDLTFL